jgi:hypothetical protein
MPMLRTVAILLFLFSPFVQSQEAYERNPVEKLDIKIDAFNELMSFNITLPPSYQKSKDKRYFVMALVRKYYRHASWLS